MEELIPWIYHIFLFWTAMASWGCILWCYRHRHISRYPSLEQLLTRERIEHDQDRRMGEARDENARHSQKMEAVSNLSAGIAHDFNNLLQVVVGNLDRIARRGYQPEWAEHAMAAAMRAGKINAQLLAFCRRQPMNPDRHLVKELLVHLRPLIEAVINPTEIELTCYTDDDVGEVYVDANQFESAILNMAINARDAMLDGGHLAILAGRDDDRVIISVEDTGIGMSEDTRQRAFDPFFTTKEVGKGTGLGLSQVHGFVRQSGGDITIISKEGRGTTITIVLEAIHECAHC